MSAPQTIRSATRRLVALTVLRWLPVGLTTPITVLLAQSRGLSLAELGVLFTVHGAVVVVLELPTGGLADVLGRRPVVVAGAVLYLLSCLVFATATSFPAFLAAILLLGLGRTLDSGPVEAWYVDTVHRIHPTADVPPGLAPDPAAHRGAPAAPAPGGGRGHPRRRGGRRRVAARAVRRPERERAGGALSRRRAPRAALRRCG